MNSEDLSYLIMAKNVLPPTTLLLIKSRIDFDELTQEGSERVALAVDHKLNVTKTLSLMQDTYDNSNLIEILEDRLSNF
jgi:hypothetical protein